MDKVRVCVNCVEHYETEQSNSNEPQFYCSWECESEDRNDDVI